MHADPQLQSDQGHLPAGRDGGGAGGERRSGKRGLVGGPRRFGRCCPRGSDLARGRGGSPGAPLEEALLTELPLPLPPKRLPNIVQVEGVARGVMRRPAEGARRPRRGHPRRDDQTDRHPTAHRSPNHFSRSDQCSDRPGLLARRTWRVPRATIPPADPEPASLASPLARGSLPARAARLSRAPPPPRPLASRAARHGVRRARADRRVPRAPLVVHRSDRPSASSRDGTRPPPRSSSRASPSSARRRRRRRASGPFALRVRVPVPAHLGDGARPARPPLAGRAPRLALARAPPPGIPPRPERRFRRRARRGSPGVHRRSVSNPRRRRGLEARGRVRRPRRRPRGGARRPGGPIRAVREGGHRVFPGLESRRRGAPRLGRRRVGAPAKTLESRVSRRRRRDVRGRHVRRGRAVTARAMARSRGPRRVRRFQRPDAGDCRRRVVRRRRPGRRRAKGQRRHQGGVRVLRQAIGERVHRPGVGSDAG